MNENEEDVNAWKAEPTETEMLVGIAMMGTIIVALLCGTLYNILLT